MFFFTFPKTILNCFKCNSIPNPFSQFNLLHLPTYTCMQVSLISHVSRREFTFSLMLLVENENNVVEVWLPLIFSWTFYFTFFFKIPSGSEIRTIFSRSSEKNEPNSHENSQDWEFLLCSDRHRHAVVLDICVQLSLTPACCCHRHLHTYMSYGDLQASV